MAAETNLWQMRWVHSIALILQLTSLHMNKRKDGQIFMQLLSWFHMPYSSYCFEQVYHCNLAAFLYRRLNKCRVFLIICSLAVCFVFQLARMKSSFTWILFFHSHWLLLHPGRGRHTFGDYPLTNWFHWNLFYSLTAFRRRVGHSGNKWAPALLHG